MSVSEPVCRALTDDDCFVSALDRNVWNIFLCEQAWRFHQGVGSSTASLLLLGVSECDVLRLFLVDVLAITGRRGPSARRHVIHWLRRGEPPGAPAPDPGSDCAYPDGGPQSFPAHSPLGGQFVTLGSLFPNPPVLDDGFMQVNSCRSTVLAAVAALPTLERETLALVFYRGMSCDEVAATMKTTVDVVRDRLHEGSRTLLAGVGGGL